MLLSDAKDVRVGTVPVKAVYAGTVKDWPPTPTSEWGPDEHIFDASPPTGTSPQGAPFTFGFRFTPVVDGRITGVRFFSYHAASGRPVSIWSDGGTKLAHGVGGAEASTGWQIIPLDTPLPVKAGVPLVTSYGWLNSWSQFGYTTAAVVSASPNLTAHKGSYYWGDMDTFPATDGGQHYYADVVYQEKLASASAYGSEVLSDSPLGYWRLGETGTWVYGMPAVDATGRHDGVYTASPTLGVPGLLTGDANAAMTVAGANGQGVQIPNYTDYQIGTLTLEAWIKTANPGASYRSVAVKQNAYGIFVIDGVIGTYVWGNGSVVSTGVSIADNVRHHVVMVCQEGVAGGSQFYCDGVAVGAPFTYVTSSQGVELDFGYNAFGGQEFIGVIDEVAIYGHVLSPARIAAHYAAGTV